MKRFEVALFDGDGTLFDSMDAIHYSINSAFLDVYGRPVPIEVLHQYGGHTLANTLLLCAGGEEYCDPKTLTQLTESYVHHDKKSAELIVPYRGVVNSLKELKKNRIQLGINTNRGLESLTEVLDRNKMLGIFDVFVTGELVRNNKPDRESVDLALKWLGWNRRSSVIMIGDTDKDIGAGKAAGVSTGAVTWGHQTEAELRALKADYYFDTLRGVRNTILNNS